MGDFYELFFEDAITAAPLLGIALTSRNKKAQDETPMCGVPHHSVAGPINKLLMKGFKIAICDQVEDPKTAKGIVKRAITRILTPGMVYDVETLDQSKAHYLASFDERSVAFLDLSTGEALWFALEKEKSAFEILMQMPVAELVVSESQRQKVIGNRPTSWVISVHDTPEENPEELAPETLTSCQRLLSYVHENNSAEVLQYLRPFERRNLQGRMKLSSTTHRHLEIFQNSRGEEAGSLFSVLNQTKTSAGTRRLREWMHFPLMAPSELKVRWDLIDRWRQNLGKLKALRDELGRLGDLERRLARLAQPSGSARDVLSLSQGILIALSALKKAAIACEEARDLEMLAVKIQNTLVEEPPLLLRQGGLIRKGVNPDLDEYITLTTEAHSILAQMEAREREVTGIPSLKIRYNNVFGYYLEVTHTHKDKVPDHYKRKQTLTTAERYYTDELMELEKKILTAESKRNELEYQIFEDLKTEALSQAAPISWLAHKAADLDAITTMAWVSLEKKWVRPQISGGDLKLISSRHAVVETTVRTPFVPNDIVLGRSEGLLLTGPNMAGKSTLMRQVALTAILCQMGSFVPAQEAHLPLYDQIFTRIGAQDLLAEGLSTFMVEMTETAELLKNATENSLVILDEIGRGTSTYDGLSLAEAILEYLVKQKVGQLLFATHYHEITVLAERYSNLHNAHMSVVERKGNIEFLHSLVMKPAGKSYGIQVARLAGLPQEVITMAQKKLVMLERGGRAESVAPQQLGFDQILAAREELTKYEALKALAQKIHEYNLLEKSPLESLNQIQTWKNEIKELH